MNKLKEICKETSNSPRDTWEDYFMSVAYIVSLRSTCGSRRVGAIMVNGLEKGKRRIIATGYNGYPAGAKHCLDGGCPRFIAKEKGLLQSGDYTNAYPCDAFHAEANALFQMMKSVNVTKEAVMFTTTFPCMGCAKKMNGAGIKTIYYAEGYPDNQSEEYLKRYNMQAIKLEPKGTFSKVVALCQQTPIGVRDNWESYFMSLAMMVSLRSKSNRQKEGAVLINSLDEKRIIATGYNGFPEYRTTEAFEGDQFTAVENVLNQMMNTPHSTENTVLFTTAYPTFDTMVMINGAGIKQVFYAHGPLDQTAKEYAERYNIAIKKV